MSRRNRPPNRFGCKPDEDVCVEHDRPLECPHGCKEVALHKCGAKAIACPFCLARGFDLIGLKDHLLRGLCVDFNQTGSPLKQFGDGESS